MTPKLLLYLAIYGPPILLITVTGFKLLRMIRRERPSWKILFPFEITRYLLEVLPLILAVLGSLYLGWLDGEKHPRYSWSETPLLHTYFPMYLFMASAPALIVVNFLGQPPFAPLRSKGGFKALPPKENS